jgi:hypothetical protein
MLIRDRMRERSGGMVPSSPGPAADHMRSYVQRFSVQTLLARSPPVFRRKGF